jgi:trans-aconitate methyltransferase
MSAWKAFYEGREGHDYQSYVEQRYAPFINAINDRIGSRDLVLEIGCGTGTITKALYGVREFPSTKFCATDVDPAMVNSTRQRMGTLDVAVYAQDALNSRFPTQADVVHSHGMLEHFSDDDIRKIIANYSSARVQVHYVPGLYPEPTFGDERLMSVADWWRIAQPDQILTFNEGLDYALIFERH